MAARLRAGVVWANTYNKFDPTSPFGGYKESASAAKAAELRGPRERRSPPSSGRAPRSRRYSSGASSGRP
jgi:hypothetical protein